MRERCGSAGVGRVKQKKGGEKRKKKKLCLAPFFIFFDARFVDVGVVFFPFSIRSKRGLPAVSFLLCEAPRARPRRL